MFEARKLGRPDFCPISCRLLHVKTFCASHFHHSLSRLNLLVRLEATLIESEIQFAIIGVRKHILHYTREGKHGQETS